MQQISRNTPVRSKNFGAATYKALMTKMDANSVGMHGKKS